MINLVNILIADDDLNFSKDLINNILSNEEVKICNLCTNGKEVLQVLDNEKIDIIILDLRMPIFSGIEVLDNLSNLQKEKYKNSIIVISGDDSYFSQLMKNPLVFDYVIKGTKTHEIAFRINRLIEHKDISAKRKKIIDELKKIGYDINYKGTIYLIEAILNIYTNRDILLDNLQRDVYPIIAKMYNKTPHNIKCNINNATELMYYKCESKVLKEYFKFYDDTKPSIKTVIYTVLNKLN